MPRLKAGQRRGTTIPCKVSGVPPIRSAAKALRSHPRRSEKVVDVHSPSILKLVSTMFPPPPHPRCHPHVLVGSWYRRIFSRNFSS
jgi:hypothetical protein